MRSLYIFLMLFLLAGCQTSTQVIEPLKNIPNQSSSVQKTKNKKPITDNTAPEKHIKVTFVAPTINVETDNNSLWTRLQSGITLDDIHNSRVEENIQWYLNNPSFINNAIQGMNYFLFFILEELEAQKAPLDIALIPLVESQYNPFAMGIQAVGMWQIIPATGKHLGLHRNEWYDGLKDPQASSKAAITYFKYLLNYFDNDMLLALAAYNSGEGTVRNAINKNTSQGKKTDFWHLDLPPTTQDYVPKIVALAAIFKHPERYNLELPSLENTAHFESLTVSHGISFQQIASALNIPLEEITLLNAGIKPNKQSNKPQYTLYLPVKQLSNAKQLIETLPKTSAYQQYTHTIQKGETLSGIAQQYSISLDELREWNQLKSDIIVTGKSLHISTPTVEKIYHKVKNGESLWKIARHYKVSTEKLAQLNSKTIGKPLKIGETLIILTTRKQ